MQAPAPRRRGSRRRNIATIVQDKDLVFQRRDEIFRAASRVFISRGYHAATVREIAREAKLSLGGLYAYIGSKEDILYLFFDKITTTLRDEMRRAIEAVEDPVARVRAALHAGLKTTETYQDEILLMYQETKSLGRASRRAVLSREAEYVAFFEEILRDGYARGVFKGDPRLAADAVAYVCSIIALRRWSLNSRFAPEQVREGLISFILRGLGVPVEDADETLRRHAAGAVRPDESREPSEAPGEVVVPISGLAHEDSPSGTCRAIADDSMEPARYLPGPI